MAAKGKRKSPRRSGSNAKLLADLEKFIRRFVVMTDAQARVVALWIVHTHCVRAFEQTPYLSVTSPERQCGKSRLLEVMELLVADPWSTIVPSEAVLFRNIHSKMPTLLLDEIDTIFNPKTANNYEGHRAIMNAGHRRGSLVPRCVGATQKIVEFRVFCPKVLAGIGSLPDTVADRSIPIRMKRRKRSEPVEPFKRRDVAPPAEALRERIATWAEANQDALAGDRPDLPDELSDRMQEGGEPLIAIADRLSSGQDGRSALVELLTGERLDDQESMRLRLLKDIRRIFEERQEASEKPVRGIRTTDLINALCAIEEGPWGNYYGRAIEPRDLASLLSHYNVGPRPIRFKSGPQKGYKRDDLADIWTRYLP